VWCCVEKIDRLSLSWRVGRPPPLAGPRYSGGWSNFMFYTYIIKSEKTNKYYIGSCSDLEKRLHRHNNGWNKSTKSGIPWRVIYSKSFQTKQEAYKVEFKIKSYKGGTASKKLIGLV
jgi:putative endonuclease